MFALFAQPTNVALQKNVRPRRKYTPYEKMFALFAQLKMFAPQKNVQATKNGRPAKKCLP